MHPILRNVLAVLAGLVLGAIVNMGLIVLGSSLVPPPPGVDVNDLESINANIRDYAPIQFLTPFLAHALGVLAGATLTAKLAASQSLFMALIVGAFFLAGGTMAVLMIPSTPIWFSTLDLVVAYLPMAWLGYRLVGRKA
ncbi:MAG: hypothetical protein ABIY71_02890 [Flavobacteriales bacterium]